MFKSRGQINITYEIADSIWRYNSALGTKLRVVLDYNRILKSENLTDTIIFQMDDGEISYYYKGTPITNFDVSYKNNSPIQMDYPSSKHLEFLYAIINKNELEQIRLVVTSADSCGTKIRIENYRDEILFGNYVEKCSTGKIYTSGKYNQIDSIYLDTISYFDPETYEEIIEVKERKKIAIKCGDWIVNSIEGIKVEEFEPCR